MRPALTNLLLRTDPDANRLIRAMSVTPQGNRQYLIEDTIQRYKAAGLWSRFDALWMPAAHDGQAGRLNWKDPSRFACTAVNSPTFTADRGYASDGATSYLDTGFIFATHGVNFTLNSASIGIYVNAGTTTPSSSVVFMGTNDGTNSSLLVRGTSSGGAGLRGRVNGTASADLSGTLSSTLGLLSLDRPDAANINGYDEGILNGTASQASSALPVTYPVFLGANNAVGTCAYFSDNRIAFAYIGASFSAVQHRALNDITRRYLNALGAQ